MDDRHSDISTDRAALPLADAAAWFGITTDALRMRIRRGRAEAYKRDGRVYVYLSDYGGEDDDEAGPDGAAPRARHPFARSAEAYGSDRRGQRWSPRGLGGPPAADYQQQELDRLEAENERLNKRLDRQIEELSEYREMLEREQVLRQQEQRLREQLQQILERLTERQGLPGPGASASPQASGLPSGLLDRDRTTAARESSAQESAFGDAEVRAEDAYGDPSDDDPADRDADADGDDMGEPMAPAAPQERESFFAQRVILRAAERADGPRAERHADPHADSSNAIDLPAAAESDADGTDRGAVETDDHGTEESTDETETRRTEAGVRSRRAGFMVESAGAMWRDDGDAADAPMPPDGPAESELPLEEVPLDDGQAAEDVSPQAHFDPVEVSAQAAEGEAAATPATAPEPDESSIGVAPPSVADIPADPGEAADLAEMLREIGASLRDTRNDNESDSNDDAPAADERTAVEPPSPDEWRRAAASGGDMAFAPKEPGSEGPRDTPDFPDNLLDTERRNAARLMRRLLRGRALNRPRES